MRVYIPKLLPNKEQAAWLVGVAGVSRFAWNWLLDHYLKAYHKWKEDTSRPKPELPALLREFEATKGAEFPWAYPSVVVREAFKDFAKALDAFAKGAEFPEYRRKKKDGSVFRLTEGIEIEEGRLRLSAKNDLTDEISDSGWIELSEPLSFKGTVNAVTIRLEKGEWLAEFAIGV